MRRDHAGRPAAQVRGMARQVQVQDVRRMRADEVLDPWGHIRQLPRSEGHPVQRRLAPVQRPDAPGFLALPGGGARPETGEDDFVPLPHQRGAEIHRVAPDTTDGIQRHQDTDAHAVTLSSVVRTRCSASHVASRATPPRQPVRALQPVASVSAEVSATNHGWSPCRHSA